LSPGFVDIHSHSDYYLLIDPLAQSKVRQGVKQRSAGTAAIQQRLSSALHSKKGKSPIKNNSGLT
ncbi:MAG: D-aminoacylase, partial [Nitrospinae bacterium]|nr:D-aminoacylase [Nitrospinota bacterium]